MGTVTALLSVAEANTTWVNAAYSWANLKWSIAPGRSVSSIFCSKRGVSSFPGSP